MSVKKTKYHSLTFLGMGFVNSKLNGWGEQFIHLLYLILLRNNDFINNSIVM